MASEATVKAWEDKAARQKRLNKAEAEYIVNDTAAARAQAKEQAENNRQRDIASSAHERFMQMRREFIQRNHFAVSPFERKAVLGEHQARQDQAALRQHEIDMANKKNEGAIKVAEHNANGMINKGKSAAEINAGVKKEEITAGITNNEREWLGRESIAKSQADAQKEIAARANETELEKARIQGKSAVEHQKAANKGLLAQAEINQRMAQQAQATKITSDLIRANAGINATQARGFASVAGPAITAGLQNGIPLSDILDTLKKEYASDPVFQKSVDILKGQMSNGGTSQYLQ